MKRIIRNPLTNAVGIILFSAFYGLIFIVTSKHAEFENLLHYCFTKQKSTNFWKEWSTFLDSGYHAYIAYVMIALTALVVVLLLLRRHPYDEYHTSLLIQCLAVAAVLTLMAIAIFFLMILSDPNGIIEKFTLFIVIHWTTVVLADLIYVLLCRWK